MPKYVDSRFRHTSNSDLMADIDRLEKLKKSGATYSGGDRQYAASVSKGRGMRLWAMKRELAARSAANAVSAGPGPGPARSMTGAPREISEVMAEFRSGRVPTKR